MYIQPRGGAVAEQRSCILLYSECLCEAFFFLLLLQQNRKIIQGSHFQERFTCCQRIQQRCPTRKKNLQSLFKSCKGWESGDVRSCPWNTSVESYMSTQLGAKRPWNLRRIFVIPVGWIVMIFEQICPVLPGFLWNLPWILMVPRGWIVMFLLVALPAGHYFHLHTNISSSKRQIFFHFSEPNPRDLDLSEPLRINQIRFLWIWMNKLQSKTHSTQLILWLSVRDDCFSRVFAQP